MSTPSLLLFANVSQPPYCNNLFPPVRAFQKVFRTKLIEPLKCPGFVPTGGGRPALVPDEAVIENTDPPPDLVVCLGGALQKHSESGDGSSGHDLGIEHLSRTVAAGPTGYFASRQPHQRSRFIRHLLAPLQ